MAIEVSKRSGTSLIGVIDQLKEVVASEQKRLRALRISYIADQAPETREQPTLKGNISTAMFLVLTVVVAAGVKSGLLVAFGIPFSFLFAFIFVNALGYTYNFMVMFGMLLLGMLIDGAIVVELADRNMTAGLRASQAYFEGSETHVLANYRFGRDDACSIFAADALAGVTGQFSGTCR